MEAVKKVKLAIIGAGLVGKRHAAAIAKSNNADLIAIADPSADGKSYADKIKIDWFASIDELLQVKKPDGIIVSTPNKLHFEQGMKCIQQGIPVLIEKPITVSVEDGMQLVEASKKFKVPVLVGHHRRHNPVMKKAKELISSGKVGNIRAVHSQTWYYKPDSYFNQVEWRKKKGAGPIYVNLIHDVDCIRYLCGEITEVQSKSCKAIRGYENEDTTVAILSFSNGALGTITISDSIVSPWSWEMTAKEYPIYPPTPNSCYYIGGDNGSLSIPDLTFWNYPKERDWWQPIHATYAQSENSDPLINQVEHFGRVITDGEEPLVSALEGVKNLEVLDMVKESLDF